MLSPCNCNATVVPSPTPAPCPTDCIVAPRLLVDCDNGPYPCESTNGTVNLDISALVDVAACDCGTPVVYSIIEYDTTIFDTVSINSSTGVLTMGALDTVVGWQRGIIVYRINCPCNILSSVAEIDVCIRNYCDGITCPEGQACDPCDGVCKPVIDVEID